MDKLNREEQFEEDWENLETNEDANALSLKSIAISLIKIVEVQKR